MNWRFYIEKWTFKVVCKVFYRAKRNKKKITMTLKESTSSVNSSIYTVRYGRKVDVEKYFDYIKGFAYLSQNDSTMAHTGRKTLIN